MQITRQEIAGMDKRFRTNFINSLSGFKSANLVGTVDVHGISNLCIVSSVFHVGANPPLLGMIMRPHTVTRDTLQNIKDTKEFTINHVNSSMLRQAHQTSARYPSDVSEFDAVGLSQYKSTLLNAPYVEESKVRIGMQLRSIQEIVLNKTELVIGEIIEVQMDNKYVLEDGFIELERMNGVVVSGVDAYHSTQIIDRFSYAKPDASASSIRGHAK